METINFIAQRALSRRTLLRDTGITLALPWLDAMQPAFAVDPNPPMRFMGILLMSPKAKRLTQNYLGD